MDIPALALFYFEIIMKQIPNYPGYFATKDGKIWSAPKGRNYIKGRFLKPGLDTFGYYVVNLYKNGKHCTYTIHRLILETYIGPCPKDMEACHNNGNKIDNKLKNLRWDTHSNNQKDAVNHKTHVDNSGENHGLSKLTDKNIKAIRKSYKSNELNQYQLANKFNISQPNVSCVINRKIWNHI